MSNDVVSLTPDEQDNGKDATQHHAVEVILADKKGYVEIILSWPGWLGIFWYVFLYLASDRLDVLRLLVTLQFTFFLTWVLSRIFEDKVYLKQMLFIYKRMLFIFKYPGVALLYLIQLLVVALHWYFFWVLFWSFVIWVFDPNFICDSSLYISLSKYRFFQCALQVYKPDSFSFLNILYVLVVVFPLALGIFKKYQKGSSAWWKGETIE